MIFNPVPGKRCVRCMTVYPATPVYFTRTKTEKDGLYYCCKECRRKYQQEHAAEISAKSSARYKANAEQVKARVRAYQKQHPEQTKRYKYKNYLANKDKVNAQARAWQQANPDKVRLIKRSSEHRRRAKLRTAGEFKPQDVRDMYKRQKGKCYYCHCSIKDGYEIDHVVPVSRDGSNRPENIVLACPPCNARKNARMPHEWPEGGRLL